MEFYIGTNCNDEPVYCASINGMGIYNPHMSECGRFKVNPLEHYGMSEADVNALEVLNKVNGFNTDV